MNSLRFNGTRVEVWNDLAEVSERASELMIGIAREAVSDRGEFTLALAGGSTPKSLYKLLASEAKSARLPWARTQLFWTDERCVPPDNPQSNYRMVRDVLLDRITIPPEHVHRMRGEDAPLQAAEAYGAELENHFGKGDPRFSLILLGMGEDGHTASLFPHSPALRDTEHTVVANFVEKLDAFRLTMTLRTLNAASTIMFLVSGRSKARALDAVFEKATVDNDSVPASLVRQKQGELIWLVDEDAAELISARY